MNGQGNTWSIRRKGRVSFVLNVTLMGLREPNGIYVINGMEPRKLMGPYNMRDILRSI